MKRAKQRRLMVLDWRTVAVMVAPAWLVPAMAINVAWDDGISSPWNIAAAASIAAAALFVHAAWQARTTAAAAAFGIAATLLTLSNTVVAFTNASHMTNDGRDAREGRAATIERLSAQRSQWSQSRAAAVLVAGEKPADAIAADIDRAIATNARRWASTSQCDAGAVTVLASMRFCERVATLRGQLAAARHRDVLDAQIAEVDRRSASLGQVSGEPLAVAVASLAAMVGMPFSGTVSRAVPAIRDALRALTLELIASLGPAAWVLLWSTSKRDLSPVSKGEASPVRIARKPNAQIEASDDVTAFISSRVEQHDGGALRAGDAWAAWRAWCDGRGVAPGSQKRFGQAMAQRFAHDRNNGRPVYRGARLREETTSSSRLVVPFRARAMG